MIDALSGLVAAGEPDKRRFRYGVLGDVGGAARRLWLLHWDDRHPSRQHVLPVPYFFRDRAHHGVNINGCVGLLTVHPRPGGPQRVSPASILEQPTNNEAVALVDNFGRAGCWMTPTTDGLRLIAARTPCIGGVLIEYRMNEERLERQPIVDGLSAHRIGSGKPNGAVWLPGKLALQSQDGTRSRALTTHGDRQKFEPHALSASITVAVGATDSGANRGGDGGGSIGIVHV